jgi:hypothetical protein
MPNSTAREKRSQCDALLCRAKLDNVLLTLIVRIRLRDRGADWR